MTSRPALLAFLAGALVVGLVVTSVVAISASRRAAEQERRVEQLTAEVERLEDRIAALEAGGAGGLEGLLGGLLGGGDRGGLLEGLLGDGLGDLGDLGGLGGLLDGLLSGASGQLPGVRCLTPGGGGLDGLLGGFGDLLGGDRAATTGDPETVVATISEQVAELRELEFTGEVDVTFLDDDELAAELTTILDEALDPDDLADRTDVLVGLRAIPPDADLEQLSRELLETQVAGFYSPEDQRLVVRTPDGDDLRPIDRITLAHELEHALVDQAIGLPDLDDGTDADAALARLAVVEGDATLLMNLWTLEHLSLREQLGMATSSDLTAQQAQLEAFPHHLGRELVFPYTAGLDLICDRWLEGGWAAVDAAYDQPPTTTAGVLFPERADEPAADAPSLSTPPGGTERFQDTFGAAPLAWLFEAPGGETAAALGEPMERAAAWAGGAVQLWDVAGAPVVGLTLTDRQAGDPALCSSVRDWYAAAAPETTRSGSGDEVRFVGGPSSAALRCDGPEIRLAVAPNLSTAAAVVGIR
jgi:hypothetical protein